MTPADVPSQSQPNATKVNAPPPLTEDCTEILLQMQKTDLLCKYVFKWLLNGKGPHHEAATFTHINSLLYKHAMDVTQKILVLVIPKSWYFTILIKAPDKLDHWSINRTDHLIKWQYYWKEMNKDIHKNIANCALCKRKKAKMQMYPKQMMDIPDQSFHKIAIYLVTDLNISTSGNNTF